MRFMNVEKYMEEDDLFGMESTGSKDTDDDLNIEFEDDVDYSDQYNEMLIADIVKKEEKESAKEEVKEEIIEESVKEEVKEEIECVQVEEKELERRLKQIRRKNLEAKKEYATEKDLLQMAGMKFIDPFMAAKFMGDN